MNAAGRAETNGATQRLARLGGERNAAKGLAWLIHAAGGPLAWKPLAPWGSNNRYAALNHQVC